MADARTDAFELEAASIEEFLDLLERRERDPVVAGNESTGPFVRRAVCVTRLFDRRPSDHAFPIITRYVAAAFAYGEDLVSYRITTSNGMEMPSPADDVEKMAKRQQETYEDVRSRVEQRIEELGISSRVPIVEGFLHHATDPRASRGR